MKDFWLSCGHHLLDRDERGRLRVTDEFMKVYLARPELAPPPEACVVERTLHAALLSDPWRPVAAAEIDAIADADARENWQFMIALRDRLAAHRTLEATYAALVREGVRGAADLSRSTGASHPAQRARSMRRCVHAARRRIVLPPAAPDGARGLAARSRPGAHRCQWARRFRRSPRCSGCRRSSEIEVLSDDNAAGYWERSDRFDLALDLTAGRRGLAALGAVIARWVKHLLDIDVIVEPLNELRDVALAWYVGLDAYGTKIGDALWNGAEIDEATRSERRRPVPADVSRHQTSSSTGWPARRSISSSPWRPIRSFA